MQRAGQMPPGKMFRLPDNVQQNKVLLTAGYRVMDIGAVRLDAQTTQKMPHGFLRLSSRKFSNIAHESSSFVVFVLTLLYPLIQNMNASAYARKQQKMTNLRHPSPRAVVLAYDGLCTFEFGVAVEIFGLPRPEMGDDWYQFAVASVDGGELRATGGIRILADGDLRLLETADLVVIPGWRGLDEPVPEALCRSARRMPAAASYSRSVLAFSFWQPQACLTGGRQPPTGATRKL